MTGARRDGRGSMRPGSGGRGAMGAGAGSCGTARGGSRRAPRPPGHDHRRLGGSGAAGTGAGARGAVAGGASGAARTTERASDSGVGGVGGAGDGRAGAGALARGAPRAAADRPPPRGPVASGRVSGVPGAAGGQLDDHGRWLGHRRAHRGAGKGNPQGQAESDQVGDERGADEPAELQPTEAPADASPEARHWPPLSHPLESMPRRPRLPGVPARESNRDAPGYTVRPRATARTPSSVISLANRSGLSDCGPSDRRLGRVAVHLDDQAVGPARDAGLGHRRARTPSARSPWLGSTMTGRWVSLLDHRHGVEVEREPGRGLERPDTPLAEDHVVVPAGQDVLRGHEELLDRRRHPALEEDRLAGTARPPSSSGSSARCARRSGGCRRTGRPLRTLSGSITSVTTGRPVARRASAEEAEPLLLQPLERRRARSGA